MALATHATMGAALAVGAAAGVGSNPKEIADTVAGFLSDRLKFGQAQRELMSKHPMAYMFALSKA